MAAIAELGRLATRLDAPLISEHLAFVRVDGIEPGQLLPLPRTRQTLDIVVAPLERGREGHIGLPARMPVEDSGHATQRTSCPFRFLPTVIANAVAEPVQP